MKKFLFILITVIIVSGLLFSGCGEPAEETTPATTTPATTTPATTTPATTTPATTTPATTTPATTTPAGPQPVRGGVMTMIRNTFPAEIGFQPDMGSEEGSTATLWAEPLAEFNMNTEELFPALATSWEEDPENKTLTVHLREGVKFHDGTDFNAEAVIWNFELMAEVRGAPYQDETDSIDIIDDYTIQFVMNDYPYDTATALLNDINYYSPTAYKTNGKDWCYEHAVATGAFMVTDFQPDVEMTMERFDDYWRKDEGYPYLDGIVYRKIADPVVAQALLESGDIDVWQNLPVVSQSIGMKEKGFDVFTTGPVQTLIWYLYPEVKEGSFFDDIRVRQAVDAAIDFEAICDGIGKGLYIPMNQLVPEGLEGYNPDYEGIPYNADEARRLLADAGHPEGFSTNLIYNAENSDMADAAVAVQDYLSKVNINVEIISLTTAAYFPTLFGFGPPWDGLVIGFGGTGNDQACISSFKTWLGPNRGIPFQLLREWSPEVVALLDKGLHTYDAATRAEVGRELITAASKEYVVIPAYAHPMVQINQPWVHDYDHPSSGYGHHFIYKTWMDPH